MSPDDVRLSCFFRLSLQISSTSILFADLINIDFYILNISYIWYNYFLLCSHFTINKINSPNTNNAVEAPPINSTQFHFEFYSNHIICRMHTWQNFHQQWCRLYCSTVCCSSTLPCVLAKLLHICFYWLFSVCCLINEIGVHTNRIEKGN